MRALTRHLIGAAALVAFGVAGQAQASVLDTFQLDRLHINKCTGGSGPTDCTDTTIYDNHFATPQVAQPTPEVAAGVAWGNLVGTGFSQTDSKLSLGGADAELIPSSGISGKPTVNQQAQLKTPTASGETLALGRGRPFEATTVWDWAAPTADRTRYGMRLTDQGGGGGGSSGGTDIVDLTVVNRGGTIYVELRDLLADGSPAGDVVLQQIAVTGPADQIALQLAWDALNNQVLAAFGFTSGGAIPASWTTFDALIGNRNPGSVLFSDDNFTQVRVYVSGQPVPAPQALLLLVGGLLAMRLASGRHPRR